DGRHGVDPSAQVAIHNASVHGVRLQRILQGVQPIEARNALEPEFAPGSQGGNPPRRQELRTNVRLILLLE
ncbi:MAG: hypothetical protein M1415_04985, partial [Firmicutes bacterium]|nr:hypothetical protein [Bacillota bacterium]